MLFMNDYLFVCGVHGLSTLKEAIELTENKLNEGYIKS